MNYCPNCHVHVDGALEKCPLCRETLTDHPEENPLYPDIHPSRAREKRTQQMDLLNLMGLVFALAALVLNLIFWQGTPWFLAAVVPIGYSWLTITTALHPSWFFGTRVFFQLIGLTAVFLMIDYLAGWQGWSVRIVLPFLLIGSNVAIDIYAYGHKSRWKDSLVYALLFAGLGCLPIVFWSTGVEKGSMLLPILSAVASALTVLGMLRFAVRTFVLELKKRFHV